MPPAAHAASASPARAWIDVAIEPLPAREELEAMWRALETRADRSFFLSWTWIGTWLASIDCRPDLVIARMGEQVVGLGLVHARLVTRHRLLPVWTLFLHQTGHADQDVVTIEYNDFLTDRRYEACVRGACLRFLIDHGVFAGREVGEVLLGGFPGTRRADIVSLGRPVQERAAAGSAFVDLAALRAGGQTYLDTLKAATRRRIRRSLSLYRARGPIRLTSAGSTGEALDFFDRCGALHQLRWTARGQPGAFAHPFYVDFHRRLIRTGLRVGALELVEVAVADEPIGYLYNFIDRKRVYYYFSGFRFEADNRLKPGLVCHSLCIERHGARGMDVYDFMAGDQRYKLELGQPGVEIVSLAVQRPNWMLAAERPIRRLKQAIDDVRRR